MLDKNILDLLKITSIIYIQIKNKTTIILSLTELPDLEKTSIVYQWDGTTSTIIILSV